MNTTTHPGSRLPTTIPEYLEQLRAALAGADKAMIQDAVYDAEEYLRSELAENPGKSEAEVIASVAGSYGAPEEVADIYRETEVTVAKALRPPVPPKRKSLLGRFFGVAADARTYGALFYMLLSLATGIVWGARAGVSFALEVIAYKALPVLMLGGLESVPGAIVGGLAIGVLEKLFEIYWGQPLLGGNTETWFAFVLALFVLLFRPQGLFGERIIERI